jgi:hypothetical protein
MNPIYLNKSTPAVRKPVLDRFEKERAPALKARHREQALNAAPSHAPLSTRILP